MSHHNRVRNWAAIIVASALGFFGWWAVQSNGFSENGARATAYTIGIFFFAGAGTSTCLASATTMDRFADSDSATQRPASDSCAFSGHTLVSIELGHSIAYCYGRTPDSPWHTMAQKRDLNVSRRTRDEDLPGLIYHQRAQSNDFRPRNFLAQLPSQTSVACTISGFDDQV
jgi:hypothetical protein